MGNVCVGAHHTDVFKLFWHKSEFQLRFFTKPGILVLPRNRLRLDDVTLSMSSLLVVLRGPSV